MSERQYVVAKFRKDDKRGYTYHNDGAPVRVGDEVIIKTKSGADQRVHISAVDVEKPSAFDTKPIVGLAPKEQPDLLDAQR